MKQFRVWAPTATSVELFLDARRVPLTKEARSWWSVELADTEPGIDYSISVNGDSPIPDPRSPSQPHGVHGPSRTIDHSAFRWSDQSWQSPPLSAAIIYELHIGTFTPEGTFESAIAKLRYLVELGITHVELMPVAEFPGERGWGYDGVSLFAPHHTYGGPEGLKTLVNACHMAGLAVILDVVYNHLGPDGNYLGAFGPYFTDKYKTPWGPAVNLDGPGSTEVRRFFCDNARMWLRDYHFDGLRLDAIHAICDSSAIHFLEQLSSEIRDLETDTGRHFFLIAESDLNDSRVVTPREANGLGFDAQWSDDFHHALHTVLTGEASGYYADFGTITDLAKSLQKIFVYDGRESAFRKRMHGRPVIGLSAHRFLGFLQNHDQVGNRAKGDRLGSLVSVGHQKIGAALVLCAATIPMLFQGEEFGATTPFLYFTNHSDPDLGAAVSRGRREEFTAFGWNADDVPDPQDAATFHASRLDWNQARGELLDWYRDLIVLRRSTRALHNGNLSLVDVEFNEEARWLLLHRGTIMIACNFSDGRRMLPTGHLARVLLASETGFALTESTLELPPASVVILEKEPCRS